MEHAQPVVVPANRYPDEQYVWIGLDDHGLELEVVAVLKPDCLMVIHVMPNQLEATDMSRKSKYKLGPDIDLDRDVVLDNRGERITEERAREIAEHALEQVRRGRPSLTGSGRRSPLVSFRVPADLAVRAVELAEREGKSISELGREALRQYVEHEQPRSA
jgi:hypothetical protein